MAAVDEEFKKSMGGFINAGCADDVKRGISTVCSEEFPSPSSVFPLSIFLGKLLDEEVKRIRNGEASKIQEALGDVLKHCLVEINKHSNKSAFDECDYTYREISFRYHDLFAGERKIGADILSRTNINSSVLHFSTDKKADILIRCAEGFLIDDGTCFTLLYSLFCNGYCVLPL